MNYEKVPKKEDEKKTETQKNASTKHAELVQAPPSPPEKSSLAKRIRENNAIKNADNTELTLDWESQIPMLIEFRELGGENHEHLRVNKQSLNEEILRLKVLVENSSTTSLAAKELLGICEKISDLPTDSGEHKKYVVGVINDLTDFAIALRMTDVVLAQLNEYQGSDEKVANAALPISLSQAKSVLEESFYVMKNSISYMTSHADLTWIVFSRATIEGFFSQLKIEKRKLLFELDHGLSSLNMDVNVVVDLLNKDRAILIELIAMTDKIEYRELLNIAFDLNLSILQNLENPINRPDWLMLFKKTCSAQIEFSRAVQRAVKTYDDNLGKNFEVSAYTNKLLTERFRTHHKSMMSTFNTLIKRFENKKLNVKLEEENTRGGNYFKGIRESILSYKPTIDNFSELIIEQNDRFNNITAESRVGKITHSLKYSMKELGVNVKYYGHIGIDKTIMGVQSGVNNIKKIRDFRDSPEKQIFNSRVSALTYGTLGAIEQLLREVEALVASTVNIENPDDIYVEDNQDGIISKGSNRNAQYSDSHQQVVDKILALKECQKNVYKSQVVLKNELFITEKSIDELEDSNHFEEESKRLQTLRENLREAVNSFEISTDNINLLVKKLSSPEHEVSVPIPIEYQIEIDNFSNKFKSLMFKFNNDYKSIIKSGNFNLVTAGEFDKEFNRAETKLLILNDSLEASVLNFDDFKQGVYESYLALNKTQLLKCKEFGDLRYELNNILEIVKPWKVLRGKNSLLRAEALPARKTIKKTLSEMSHELINMSTAMSKVKTAVSTATRRPIDLFSVDSRIIKHLAQFFADQTAENRASLSPEALARQDLEIDKNIEQLSQHFSKSTNGLGERFAEQLKLEYRRAVDGTIVMPKKLDNIMQNERSFEEYVISSGAKKLQSHTFYAITSGTVDTLLSIQLPALTVWKGIRSLAKLLISGITLSLVLREMDKTVMPGYALRADIINPIIKGRLAIIAFRLVESFAPRLLRLMASIPIAAAEINKEGFAAVADKSGRRLKIDLPYAGGVLGVKQGVRFASGPTREEAFAQLIKEMSEKDKAKITEFMNLRSKRSTSESKNADDHTIELNVNPSELMNEIDGTQGNESMEKLREEYIKLGNLIEWCKDKIKEILVSNGYTGDIDWTMKIKVYEKDSKKSQSPLNLHSALGKTKNKYLGDITLLDYAFKTYRRGGFKGVDAYDLVFEIDFGSSVEKKVEAKFLRTIKNIDLQPLYFDAIGDFYAKPKVKEWINKFNEITLDRYINTYFDFSDDTEFDRQEVLNKLKIGDVSMLNFYGVEVSGMVSIEKGNGKIIFVSISTGKVFEAQWSKEPEGLKFKDENTGELFIANVKLGLPYEKFLEYENHSSIKRPSEAFKSDEEGFVRLEFTENDYSDDESRSIKHSLHGIKNGQVLNENIDPYKSRITLFRPSNGQNINDRLIDSLIQNLKKDIDYMAKSDNEITLDLAVNFIGTIGTYAGIFFLPGIGAAGLLTSGGVRLITALTGALGSAALTGATGIVPKLIQAYYADRNIDTQDALYDALGAALGEVFGYGAGKVIDIALPAMAKGVKAIAHKVSDEVEGKYSKLLSRKINKIKPVVASLTNVNAKNPLTRRVGTPETLSDAITASPNSSIDSGFENIGSRSPSNISIDASINSQTEAKSLSKKINDTDELLTDTVSSEASTSGKDSGFENSETSSHSSNSSSAENGSSNKNNIPKNTTPKEIDSVNTLGFRTTNIKGHTGPQKPVNKNKIKKIIAADFKHRKTILELDFPKNYVSVKNLTKFRAIRYQLKKDGYTTEVGKVSITSPTGIKSTEIVIRYSREGYETGIVYFKPRAEASTGLNERLVVNNTNEFKESYVKDFGLTHSHVEVSWSDGFKFRKFGLPEDKIMEVHKPTVKTERLTTSIDGDNNSIGSLSSQSMEGPSKSASTIGLNHEKIKESWHPVSGRAILNMVVTDRSVAEGGDIANSYKPDPLIEVDRPHEYLVADDEKSKANIEEKHVLKQLAKDTLATSEFTTIVQVRDWLREKREIGKRSQIRYCILPTRVIVLLRQRGLDIETILEELGTKNSDGDYIIDRKSLHWILKTVEMECKADAPLDLDSLLKLFEELKSSMDGGETDIKNGARLIPRKMIDVLESLNLKVTDYMVNDGKFNLAKHSAMMNEGVSSEKAKFHMRIELIAADKENIESILLQLFQLKNS